MRSRFIFAALIALSLAILPLASASAQFLDSSETISLSVTPDYPRPYDTVVVTPRSNSINLTGSRVTITANGTVVEEGSGGRSAAVTLGGPGSQTNIVVTAVSGGLTYTASITLRPTDVALVVEPQTTTHPLYKGAALVAPEGGVRIVALPDFRTSGDTRIAPGSLTYTWRLGNKILTEASGIGRSVLTATAPVRYRNADVSVTITNADESMVGYARVAVAPASPAVYAYRNDPLLGLDLSHTLSGTFAMSSEEETFRALPFHFAAIPSLSWTLSGNAASSDENLTVRTTSGTAGSAPVALSASRGGESARASFTVNFSAKRPNGIFGF